MLFQPDSVRHEFPLRATYSRQVLPPVVGFPHLRVLCLIRHPVRHTAIFRDLPVSAPCSIGFDPSPRRFRVLTFRVSIPARLASSHSRSRSLRGFPSSPTYLFLHATA